MEFKTIQVSLKQRLTIGRESKFDSLEIFVGGEASVDQGEDAEVAFAALAVKVRRHLEKEFDLAAKQPSAALQNFVQQKETAMAPPPQPVQQQQFTQKPPMRDNNCIDCRHDKGKSQGPRCYQCYMAFKNNKR